MPYQVTTFQSHTCTCISLSKSDTFPDMGFDSGRKEMNIIPKAQPQEFHVTDKNQKLI